MPPLPFLNLALKDRVLLTPASLGYVVLTFICYALIATNPIVNDEPEHWPQIALFIDFQWSFYPSLTMIPGYHALVAFWCLVTGWETPASARFFTLLLSLLSVALFYRLACRLDNEGNVVRALQYAFQPILFPFFFLIYTDSTSVMCVLLALLLSQQRLYFLAGVACLAACLIRQHNIIWVGFVMAYCHLNNYSWRLDSWRAFFCHYWMHLATCVLFVIFVVINGGIALGDVDAHKPGFYTTNIFFALFVVAVLFFPVFVARWRVILDNLRKPLTLGVLALLFPIFWLTFKVDHYYNTTMWDYFIRNGLLMLFASTWYWKLTLYAFVVFACLGLQATPLISRFAWLLYPATVAALLPIWLVEQRYYLIPLALFLALRKRLSSQVELIQLGYFIALALLIFVLIERDWYFL